MLRKWPLIVGVGCGALVLFAATRPEGRPLGWRQTTEDDSYRSVEFGLFGVTLYQASKRVPSVQVAADCRATARAAGLTIPPDLDAQMWRASRTIRPGGTQYWIRFETSSQRGKDLFALYRKQIRKSSHYPMPPSATEFGGVAPDGVTHVRIYAGSIGSDKQDIMLTFGPGA